MEKVFVEIEQAKNEAAEQLKAKQVEMAAHQSLIAVLSAEMALIELDIENLNAAAGMLKNSSATARAHARPRGLRTYQPNKSNMTIKQMVLEILPKHPNGLTALEILDHIERDFGQSIMRTSLSPQLSRLKSGGKIKRDNFTWTIYKPSTEVEGLKDLGEGRSGARLPIHSASGSTPDSSIQNPSIKMMPGMSGEPQKLPGI